MLEQSRIRGRLWYLMRESKYGSYCEMAQEFIEGGSQHMTAYAFDFEMAHIRNGSESRSWTLFPQWLSLYISQYLPYWDSPWHFTVHLSHDLVKTWNRKINMAIFKPVSYLSIILLHSSYIRPFSMKCHEMVSFQNFRNFQGCFLL